AERMYIASKNGGAFMIERGTQKPIRTSNRVSLEIGTNIYIDDYFEIVKTTFSNKLQAFLPSSRGFSIGSSAIYYADVASGAADLALECTRKGNLEIAVAYGLEIEAGAAIVDLQGTALASKKYLEFGQKEQLPVITAATEELAKKLIEHLKAQPTQ
ncbi:hypothetical protein KW783_03770, partial [Candidatus Parcubacteria bacterium]|nr:hypothetical protein [Candidatus Parcubacteria bacterium]